MGWSSIQELGCIQANKVFKISFYLGADKIYHYTHDKTNANPDIIVKRIGETKTPAGWGPRHMAISNNVAYVIFELKNRVGVYK